MENDYHKYDLLKSLLKKATTAVERKIIEERIEVVLNRIIAKESLPVKHMFTRC